jgi:hypothetical protein
VTPAATPNLTADDGWATATTTDVKSETATFNGTYTTGDVPPATGVLLPGTVTWAPGAPTITGPNGDVVATNPPITGTGSTPGNTITVKDSAGNVYCTTTVGPAPDMAWTCTPPAGRVLPVSGPTGTPKITATETDPAGNGSPGVDKTLGVDTTEADITGPADGTTVVTDTPVVTGDAPYSPDPANPTTVTVLDKNNQPVPGCTDVTVPASGKWSCTPTLPLPQGPQTLTPQVTDAAGDVNPGAPINLTVDSTKPDITQPPANTTLITDTPALQGDAPDGTTVTVLDNNNQPVPGCEDLTVTGGKWNCAPTSPLPSGGPQTLTPEVKDSNGGVNDGAPLSITVNTAAPSIDPINPTNKNTPTISGKGTVPGDQVTIKDSDGSTVCTATVGPAPDLKWSCTPSAPLKDGTHSLKATETDKGGNTNTSAPTAVKVDTSVPKTPVVDATTGGTISGTADPGVTITVTAGGQPVPGCTAVVADGNGHFACNPSPALGAGTVVTVRAVNSVGTGSLPATITVGAIAVTVQTGGALTSASTTGAATTGGLGLAGVWIAIAAIRRRDEETAQ